MKSGITIHVNVSVKSIVSSKNIAVEVLASYLLE